MVGAFEPLQYLYHMLCGSLALNGITNVVAQNVAVGRNADSIIVPYADYTAPVAYGGLPTLEGYTEGRKVPVVTLDQVMPHVDFIKLDVEGMELDVLKGAEWHLAHSRPAIYVEANPGPKQQPLIEFLWAMGYDLWWDHAAHYNPDNYRGEKDNDLPITPAPALLGFHQEHMPDLTVTRERVLR
jgi:FkbM family methyltransferase